MSPDRDAESCHRALVQFTQRCVGGRNGTPKQYGSDRPTWTVRALGVKPESNLDEGRGPGLRTRQVTFRKRLLEPLNTMKNFFAGASSRLAVTGLLAVSLSGGMSIAAAPTADAAISRAQGVKAVSIASTKKGTPYRWGATGPRSFDCSGFTSWTYKRMGKSIPRTADAQYRASHKISRGEARPGDLVFYGSGRKYHVGIYAGNGRMWHAPRTGDVVKLAKVRGGASYGRVR